MVELPNSLESASISQRLIDAIRPLGRCAIAFSGGVDSSLVARAAWDALGNNAVAITGVGPAVSQDDLRFARRVAEKIGIRHLLLDTDEIHDPSYLANDGQRCFHCKSNLYATLQRWIDTHGFDRILSGTNADDLDDYRPGLEAARHFRVIAPLADLGIDKRRVRSLAHYWELPVADRPASPCLASRVAYGESITVNKLRQIEAAEGWLNDHGLVDVRVRLHPGGLARIEVAPQEISKLTAEPIVSALYQRFRELGFQFVTLDLRGRESGSLNRLLPILPQQ